MDRKDVEVMTCCCKGNEDGNVKHKQRDEQEKKALMTRLSRIEGQVRGIRAMVIVWIFSHRCQRSRRL